MPVCTGDLLDRGPENMQCVSLLDQKWFSVVRGNHEELCIKGEIDGALKDLHKCNGGEWFYRQFLKTQERIRQKIMEMPLVIEIELEYKKIGIVHADIDIHDWNLFKEDITKGDYNIPDIASAYSNALRGKGKNT